MSELESKPTRIEIPLESGAMLRQMDLSDAPLLFRRLRDNKKPLGKSSMYVPRRPEEVEERIRGLNSKGGMDFGIWVGDDLAGEIGLGVQPENPLAAEIFYWVDKGHRGQGHATSAVKNLANYALNERGFHLLTATVGAGNFASQRTLQKADFQRIGDDPVIKSVYFRRAHNPLRD